MSIVDSDGAAVGSSVTELVLSLAEAPTDGNLLVAAAVSRAVDSHAPENLDDPAGWTLVQTVTGPSGNVGAAIKLWYRVADSDPAGLTITWSQDFPNSTAAVLVEFDDQVDGGGPVDVSDQASDNTEATSGGSPTLNTTVADALLVTVTGVRDGGDGSWGWTDSFTNHVDVFGVAEDGPVGIALASRLVAATGNYSTTASWADAGRWGIPAVAFDLSGGGGGPVAHGPLGALIGFGVFGEDL